MRRVLVPMFITMWLVPAAAADRPRPAVPVAVDRHGGVFVDVLVNGAGPFTFLLDTGAARSLVADDLARELGAPVVARSEVVTSAGSDMRLVVRVASIAIASSRVDGVLAPIVPAPRLARLGRGVRGLLGQDFLSAFNYTLDYRRSRLTWDEPLTCDTRGAVRMVAAEGRFVAALEDGRGAPLRLVPDSGAEVAVLFQAPVDAGPGQTAILAGLVSGDRPARTAILPRLRVGSVTMHDVQAIVAEREDLQADGLLPLHGFSSVSFSAGGGCLVVRK
jgi:predicted aspartyl protease